MSKFIFSKVSLVVATCLLTITPTVSAFAAPPSSAQHTTQGLPIALVTPTDGATSVRPDAVIQFVLNPADPNYTQFVQQYQRGLYSITLNGQLVQGILDTTTNTITLTNPILNRYTMYTVLLANSKNTVNHGKGQGNGSGTSVNSYTFSFTTGSALHEATHLTATVEQSPVLVTDGGKLDVKLTDDYGLSADNATVQVTGSSATFSAPVLSLTSSGDGTGVIDLTDHVKERVNLTVTAQDHTYQDAVDTQTATSSEQFLAGPPDHLSIYADSPLTVGYGEQVTGTVYDVYNNTVEDTTTVSADTTGGLLAPQQENTANGGYAFTFTAPTKVQDVVLTAQSGTTSGQVTVHLKPDQPANLTLTPVAATVKAGETDDVQVLVTDQYGNPNPNEQLTVSSTGNSQVASTVTTDDTGHATIPVSDKKAESVTITATTANGVQGTATITVKAGDPANLTLTPATPTVKAGDTDNVQALVTDQYDNPVPNASLTVLGTGSSQVPSTVTTDSTGHTAIPVSDKKAEAVTVTATTANGVQGTAQITIVAGDPAILTLTPATSTVQAGDTDNVQALVTDPYGNPISNVQLAVSSTGSGQVLSAVTTDNTGYATIPFSDTKAESVTVTAATAIGLTGTTQITVQASSPAHLTLTPDTSTVKAGDTDQIQAALVDQYGNPIPNAQLTVSGTGSGQVPSTVTTDTTGYAMISFRDTKVESVTVTAAVAGGVQTSIQIIVQAGAPAQVAVQADQTAIIANGTSTANATVSVVDAYGNPVPNAALTLSSTSHVQFPASLTTDGNGQATFSITDTVSESIAITLTTANGVTSTLNLQSQNAVVMMDNLIPVMTSNTKPLGIASASSEYIGYGTTLYRAYYAFDNDSNTCWISTDNWGYLVYDFQEPTVVKGYAIQYLDNNLPTAPLNWTFEGWNGTNWIVLDTQNSVTDWVKEPVHSFAITNSTSYTKYRLNVSSINNYLTNLAIARLTMSGYYATPFTPNGLINTKNGDGQVSLSWQTGNGVTGFNVYQDGVKVNDTPITSTSYTITGLVNNQLYHFTVSAVNSSGESPQTAPVMAMPFATNLIPVMTSNTAPLGKASSTSDDTNTDYAYKAFDNDSSTDWASNLNSGVLFYDFQEPTVVKEYTIQVGDPGSAPLNWRFEGWNGTTWTVLDTQNYMTDWTKRLTEYFTTTNTTAYTKYGVFVTSNNNGVGILAITRLTMSGYYATPFAPNGLFNTKNGDGQVSLSWQSGNGVTGFNVYQDGVKVNVTPITSTSYTITGLVNGQVYHYTVSAVNSSGESPQSAPVLAMPFATNLIPVMTSNTKPLGIASSNSDNLSTDYAYKAFDNDSSTDWASNSNSGYLVYDFQEPTVVQEYTIQYLDNNLPTAPTSWTFEGWDGAHWIVLDTQSGFANWANAPVGYFTIANTTAYTKYRVNVTSINNYLSDLAIAHLTMSGYYATPFTPNGLINTKNGDGQVSLSWQTGNGVTGFNVYQDGVKVNATPITSTSYTITGLVNGQIYHFTVSAVNSSGESPQTAPIRAMPFATNLIPVMTSNTAPLGIASASSEYASNYSAYKAFDNDGSTYWSSATIGAGFLDYDFQKPIVVKEYAIQNIHGDLNSAPRDWTFEGWDGTQWVVLDTQTNISNWLTLSTEFFTTTNTTAYTKYRLHVTSVNGYADVGIASLVFANS